jgi:hypothetical protein
VNIDLFCRVIDNYGDIGVCWRLARQLSHEHAAHVRLIVDDLNAFTVIAPEIDPKLERQSLNGIDVIAWQAASSLLPAAVVIEAFACDPPDAYVRAMAASAIKPIWINLEYLSAEAWIEDVHGMPSPHPRLPLTKFFFCPGFTEKSGGLIREKALRPEPPSSIPSPSGAGLGWRQSEGALTVDGPQSTIPHPGPPPLREGDKPRLFAFCYPHAPLRALASALDATVTIASPISDCDPIWQHTERVPQTEFDALLANFDVLVVRGEDSFLRAQFAAKPLIWHIYPTTDNAHLIKLDAWLNRYCRNLNSDAASAYRSASHAFNTSNSDPAAYARLTPHLPALAVHAHTWRATLFAQDDLATQLLRFIALQQSATKP